MRLGGKKMTPPPVTGGRVIIYKQFIFLFFVFSAVLFIATQHETLRCSSFNENRIPEMLMVILPNKRVYDLRNKLKRIVLYDCPEILFLQCAPSTVF